MSGPADEGHSLQVLLVAGGLAHDHQVGVRVPPAEDDLGADGRKRAPGAP